MRVAVIGLGAMGAPIARNLLKRGHTVAVFARRPEAMAPLVAAGAAPASSPADAASRADVVITMVLDIVLWNHHAEDVALAKVPRRLLQKVVSDARSVTPMVSTRCAACR